LKLGSLLKFIERNVSLLDSKVREIGVSGLLGDEFHLNSVLHILQTSCQALIDLASHVIAEAGLGYVERYRDIPKVLYETGVLSESEAALLRRIIGFRNIVVHGYTGVSVEIIRVILEEKRYRDIMLLAVKLAEWGYRAGIDP